MKKLVLLTAVFGVFVIYSLGIRHQKPVIGKPVASSKSTSVSSAQAANTPSSTNQSSSSSSNTSSTTTKFKDGTYNGSVADAYYGNVQVSATISGGKITGVKFLQYPNTHSTSVYINQQAMPYLQQEAIQSQSPNVQLISGATYTSQAFIQSLQTAPSKANA